MSTARRTVSVIAPCRNEQGHIVDFCRALTAQHLPEGMALEVLIADGRSDDGTRELLDDWCRRDDRFVRVDNPGRIVSTGLNRCLAQARGEVIVRMDIHTRYASDYIAQCLAALQRSGADNVGGPWVAQPATPEGWPAAIAAAFQSRWVAGGARSRDRAYEGEVDTVYLGCWPRASFQRYGGFDEQLVRNQDDEHNLRIRAAGGKVWQSGRIRSVYQSRSTPGQLARQWRQYGYWKPFVMRKHGQAASWRHLAPGVFVGLQGLLLLASTVSDHALAGFLTLTLLYLLAVLATALLVAREAGWRLLPRLPVVIGLYHLAYGAGSLQGWADVLRGREPDPAFGRLTR
ncbi:glycosyltransferase family 2 protein [Sphaerotilus mobilis]|uniref:Cellulose synthase/poly-beta-1,6-N-acetylglucosamine synthase-like glycosyltransferase n=1 Tax=Sphaerotilus mobilis TaxID=47994 RepID=A0A4Q7LJX2_9BURK|nr:glycosyltransferase family 2 protein [Sphaerotilus mobilis]RZS54391.1 cellulose synthase/poly-beta-1,6-N-acetylglucosamine synthase-like glycosyltransferase [Sphaerotilus mobilis]